MGYAEEFLVAGAGPGVNLLLAAMLARMPGGEVLAGISLALAVLNLLPVRNLDGARMLRCGLSAAVGDRISVEILRCLDFCFTLLFSCAGLWLFLCYRNLTLFLMSFWMVLGSGDEKRSNFLKKNRKRGCQIRPKKLK
jgi:stage IV sporulation protein FB